MATDSTAVHDAESVPGAGTAYISPVADFLVLFGFVLLVALAGVAIVLP
jgi:hypothetical protein